MKTVENSYTDEVLQGKRDYAILEGNCLETLKQIPSDSVQVVITSPPYFGLRNYGTEPQMWWSSKNAWAYCNHKWVEVPPRRFRTEHDTNSDLQKNNRGANCVLPSTKMCEWCKSWEGELGLEPTPEMFVNHLAQIFDEVKRVLRPDGVCFLNIADSYWKEEKNNEHEVFKGKDLCLVPQRLAIALQERGWYLRNEIIWAKKNCMPESMDDRCTRSHEQIWLLSKTPDYYYDKYAVTTPPAEKQLEVILSEAPADAITGANLRTVWIMNASGGFKDSSGRHHATFPEELPERCIRLATSEKGCCSECGTPYRRVIEKKYPQVKEVRENVPESDIPDWYGSGGSSFRGHSGYVKADGTSMVPYIVTTGWEKGCKCKTNETKPCVVLDIFNGSGTTGLIAMQLGRSYLGCELLAEYVQMTHERYTGGLPLLQFME